MPGHSGDGWSRRMSRKSGEYEAATSSRAVLLANGLLFRPLIDGLISRAHGPPKAACRSRPFPAGASYW